MDNRTRVVIGITSIRNEFEPPDPIKRAQAASRLQRVLQDLLNQSLLDPLLAGCAVAVWVEEG